MPDPTVILTRPKAASDRVAAALGGIPTLISPVTEIVGTGHSVDLAQVAGVILTSANAVPFLPDLTGVPVYCVGARTAEASRGDVRLIAMDADDLITRIDATGPLLHAHGRETRGSIAKRLRSAGIETIYAVVYEQKPVNLTPEAQTCIEGDAPTILPIWSPRSAERIAEQIVKVGAGLHVITLSPAVADAWAKATGGASEICAQPTGDEMIARIVAAASR
ncbi:MAG: uroporphyrinogen-III synthase [Pseudomonadota bacterium]|nr:uroporphyrinogen-III synthase [Pseudomonadota bacterium]